VTAAGAALFLAGAASAQRGTEVADPPAMGVQGEGPSMMPADAGAAEPGEQTFNLTVKYVEGAIDNPATGRADRVRLRSYTSPDATYDGRFVAPAIHTRPGETIRVMLSNELPADASCAADRHGNVNDPHCFNGTNLHTHGLWVNPSGNGDNVLLSIDPGSKFEFEFPIRPEHPAGTFWYHTHRHGSTALQVSSGMAGALIIHGDRLPTPSSTGDLDTLLKGVRDRTLIFQQIQYYCLDPATSKIKQNPNRTYRCDQGDLGIIESYDPFKASWGSSGRYTSINGRMIPDFNAKQGTVERWRLIHGGVRDSIGLKFLKARRAALAPPERLSAERMERFVDQNCEGDALPFHLVAADGITMASALRREVATLQPGYRFDALVVFPEAGSYCVVDAESLASESVGGVPSGTRLLGMVRVAGDGGPTVDLTAQLVAAAEQLMPDDVRPRIVADLRNGLSLASFVPHPTVADSEIAGKEVQEMTFNMDDEGPTTLFQVGGQGYAPRVYDPARLDRTLTLGTAQEWKLMSQSGGHPFHIHVNPFQIVEVLDTRGNDLSVPGGTSQFAGLKGAWKDTLWVPRGHKIRVRTRYERFIGEFVLHCHILDHEDRGMMQNVAIVLPGGTPASVNAGGHEGH
jgi:FtsP/CotA-like multicopper oxidase with cupredoxin domain